MSPVLTGPSTKWDIGENMSTVADELGVITPVVSIATPAVLTVTPAAVGKATSLLSAEPEGAGMALRIAVKSGGCSGFQYNMYFDTEQASDDVVQMFDALKVVCDPQSAELLTGATVDYSDGLSGAGFHITNPNATRTCGCGNSFS
jgi:iron-sulfur cluster assembly accessory protein